MRQEGAKLRLWSDYLLKRVQKSWIQKVHEHLVPNLTSVANVTDLSFSSFCVALAWEKKDSTSASPFTTDREHITRKESRRTEFWTHNELSVKNPRKPKMWTDFSLSRKPVCKMIICLPLKQGESNEFGHWNPLTLHENVSHTKNKQTNKKTIVNVRTE